MELEEYKKYQKQIMLHHNPKIAYATYIQLLHIFVQDCQFPLHQKYFGDLTKRKAQILFDLYPFMLLQEEHPLPK